MASSLAFGRGPVLVIVLLLVFKEGGFLSPFGVSAQQLFAPQREGASAKVRGALEERRLGTAAKPPPGPPPPGPSPQPQPTPQPGTLPQSSFLVGSTCSNYKPSSVNWKGLHDALLAYFRQAGTISGFTENIPYARVASLAVRVSFHDAGAFQGGAGGADGSAMLNTAEQTWDGNMVPFPFLHYVRTALQTLIPTYPISWADGVVVAGIAGAHFLGARVPFTVALGRCDNAQANPKVLPGSGITAQQFAQYWAGVGISITDAAALLGSHSMIGAPGADRPGWSTALYEAQTTGNITVTNPNAVHGVNGVSWVPVPGGPSKPWRFTVNDAYNAPSLVSKLCSACPFASQFIAATNSFVRNGGRWNQAYAAAYDRMTRIGARFAPSSTATPTLTVTFN